MTKELLCQPPLIADFDNDGYEDTALIYADEASRKRYLKVEWGVAEGQEAVEDTVVEIGKMDTYFALSFGEPECQGFAEVVYKFNRFYRSEASDDALLGPEDFAKVKKEPYLEGYSKEIEKSVTSQMWILSQTRGERFPDPLPADFKGKVTVTVDFHYRKIQNIDVDAAIPGLTETQKLYVERAVARDLEALTIPNFLLGHREVFEVEILSNPDTDVGGFVYSTKRS